MAESDGRATRGAVKAPADRAVVATSNVINDDQEEEQEEEAERVILLEGLGREEYQRGDAMNDINVDNDNDNDDNNDCVGCWMIGDQ